ncbi:hypothetical protein ACP26L_28290 [Paenibacillus sp. S-38]|uniref:hypothetical protein n=1 Tax=Paenibacillus sp. S-38 TaxID=3416710 RepID=UPI003CEFE26F
MGNRRRSLTMFLILLILGSLVSPAVYATNSNYFYDSNGRLETVKGELESIRYEYDPNGNLTRKKKDENLLLNGHFEQAAEASAAVADRWTKAAAPGTLYELVQSSEPSNGTKAQKVSVSGMTQSQYSGIMQDVSVVPGNSMNVSGRVKIEALQGAKVQLYVDFLTSTGQYTNSSIIAEYDKLTNGGYITIAGSGAVPTNAAIARVYAFLRSTGDSGGGTVYIDDTDLRYGGANLISNGGFETTDKGRDVAYSWSKAAAPNTNYKLTETSIANGGMVQRIAATGMTNWQYSGVMQDVAVIPNRPIQISGRVNVESLQNAKVQLYVDFMTVDGQYTNAPTVAAEYEHTTGGGYITISSNGVVPSNASFARVYAFIRSLGSGGGGTIYIDAVDLQYGEPNLLANAGFESYTGSNNIADLWRGESSQPLVSEYRIEQPNTANGRRVQKIVASSLNSGQYTGIAQEIGILPNCSVQVKGRVNIESIQSAKVQLYVDYLTSSGQYTYVAPLIAEYSNTTGGGYVTISATGVVPSNAAFARVYAMIRSTGTNGTGVVRIDALELNYGNDNMLSNPGFEAYTKNNAADSWARAEAPGTVYENSNANAAAGDRLQKIAASGLNAGHYSGIAQDVAVAPNKKLSISSQVKVEGLQDAKFQLYVDFMTADGQYTYAPPIISEYAKATNGGYITVAGTGTVPANAAFARVYAMIRSTGVGGAGVIFVDVLELRYEEQLNLLSNSKFELSTTDPAVADSWRRADAPGAQYRLVQLTPENKVQKATAAGLSTWQYSGIVQDTAVIPNSKINISGKLNVESLQNAKVQIYVDFLTYDGQFTNSSVVAETASTTNGAYVTISNSGTVPANAAFARVYAFVRSTGSNGSGTFLVDDLRLWY